MNQSGRMAFGADQATYHQLHQQQMETFTARLADYAARYYWPADRVRSERERSLRALLAIAKRNSPWHARRLKHIDPRTFTEDDVPKLPVMTKADLMDNFDEIVTDRRVTLAAVEAHLAQLKSDAYLLNSCHAVVTGGSSGLRGVFVYDWEGWLVMGLSSARVIPLMDVAPAREVVVSLATSNSAHGSAAFANSFAPWFMESFAAFIPISITAPLPDIVHRLNAAQPTVISTYPSIARQLCAAAADGSLRIRPHAFLVGSEPLYPDVREGIHREFQASIYNFYGCTELSCVGFSCPAGPGLHLSDDLAIIEAVDPFGESVAAGVRSAKLLVTNLFNQLMPLIRYELDDSVVLMDGPSPCACGSIFQKIEDVQGRGDDSFVYPDGMFVHPVAFQSALTHEPAIFEYQVRQTPEGAHIKVVATRPFDGDALVEEITGALRATGFKNPAISLEFVNRIERTAAGKLRYFVPLGRQNAA